MNLGSSSTFVICVNLGKLLTLTGLVYSTFYRGCIKNNVEFHNVIIIEPVRERTSLLHMSS